MDRKRLVGRSEQIRLLNDYYDSDKSEFVAIYGRRRVGKTYLVCETLGEHFDFEFSGMYRVNSKVQMREFQKSLNKLCGGNDDSPGDWFTAFDRLKDYLLGTGREKVVVFLDELPWMDTPRSDFLAALSSFWNGWHSRETLLKLYVCGSATTWMVDKLIGDKGGLYGRISRSIYLAPFSLAETEKYLNDIKKMGYGRKQILDSYMVFGGIPYYLDMLDNRIPFSANVDRLFFSENAALASEFDFLFRSLFKESTCYRRVIEFLSTKMIGLTRDEISDGSKLSGGELSRVLGNLISCDFIRCYMAPGKKERYKVYQLTDMFSLFYLRFVKDRPGGDTQYWTNLGKTGKKNSWTGYAFEQVCLNHINQIKQKLGISGILSEVYAWSKRAFTDSAGNEWGGGQIDLIIDRNDGVMNLCEMKYSTDEYSIDAGYEQTVRNRMVMFRSAEKTNKDLRCTFVTLYGVKLNKHSNIVDDQILLDDLFFEYR